MAIRITLALVAAAALTIGPAILAGSYANRWGAPADLSGASRRVEAFPREFGSWTFSKEGDSLSAEVCQELGLAGYISRAYTNRETGTVITLLLMVGQPGPLLRHPPNICYANRANEQVGKMTAFDVSLTTPTSTFNLLEYKPPSTLTNERFVVAYSMSTTKNWHVPSMPRIEFGGAPALYKVQMLMVLDAERDRKANLEILHQFASDFCTAFEHSSAMNVGTSRGANAEATMPDKQNGGVPGPAAVPAK